PTNTIGVTTRATISAAMTPAPIRTPAPPPNGSGCRGTSRDTSPLQHATGAITRPAADAPLLAGIVGRVDGNLAEPLIGVGLRIIRNRVGVPQIFANVFEGFHLLLPGLGEIGFAAGPLRDPFENVARDRVLIHFGGGNHVEWNALVLGHRADVVRRHHAGVVGTVGEDDDHLAAGDLALHRPGGS